MLEDLLKKKHFPSPLIIESQKAQDIIQRFAGFALCEKQSFCGLCFNCKQVSRGFHPDWLKLSGDIKMDEIREQLAELRKRPLQSKLRLLSINEMQNSSPHIQNFLLKTLEEPSERWVILLGVNSIYKLLETIRSRCFIYRAPRSASTTSLAETEQNIFNSIENNKEIYSFLPLESIFKDRKKTKDFFLRLLQMASEQHYPGNWGKVAPVMEERIADLDRNLHPKVVWGKIMSTAQA